MDSLGCGGRCVGAQLSGGTSSQHEEDERHIGQGRDADNGQHGSRLMAGLGPEGERQPLRDEEHRGIGERVDRENHEDGVHAPPSPARAFDGPEKGEKAQRDQQRPQGVAAGLLVPHNQCRAHGHDGG